MRTHTKNTLQLSHIDPLEFIMIHTSYCNNSFSAHYRTYPTILQKVLKVYNFLKCSHRVGEMLGLMTEANMVSRASCDKAAKVTGMFQVRSTLSALNHRSPSLPQHPSYITYHITCYSLTPVGSLAPHNHLLTSPFWDRGENSSDKSCWWTQISCTTEIQNITAGEL